MQTLFISETDKFMYNSVCKLLNIDKLEKGVKYNIEDGNI